MADHEFPKVYVMKAAAPSRAVLLTAAALGITLNEIPIDLTTNEQLQPSFLKVNPQHTIPTLDDEGKIIWDSHAINIYLVTKYSNKCSLYPEDLYQRAIVHQRLLFDASVLFSTGLKIIMPILRGEAKSIDRNLKEDILEAYGFLEKFLEGSKWVAGNEVTIADFSLLTSVGNVSVLIPVDDVKFPNITKWVANAKELPYHYVNEEGLNVFRAVVNENMCK